MESILKSHDVEFKKENQRILAKSEYSIKVEGKFKTFTEWVDITEFNNYQLMEWLGY